MDKIYSDLNHIYNTHQRTKSTYINDTIPMDGVLYGIPDGFSSRIICPSHTMTRLKMIH